MTSNEKALVWRYRYSQKKNRKVLLKFLMSVNWGMQKEQQEAMSLLMEWEPIELEQALSLLGGMFSLNSEYQDICVV